MLTEDKLLNTREVAERLHVSLMTIHRWIDRGEFPQARRKSPVANSPYMIPESDVIAFERRRDAGAK